MSTATFSEIINPWLVFLALVVPLYLAERMIHQKMYVVGYLITKDKQAATIFYYMVFFPGVFLHEFLQYLLAGVFNVKIKKIITHPQKQDNGTLRYDFVIIEKDKLDNLRASLLGGLPFLIGCAVVWWISNSLLDLNRLTEAFASFGSADLLVISDSFQSALTGLFNTPDFWLWLYILFAISNGMIPTKEDARGLRFILMGLGGITALFLVIGLSPFIIQTLQGPVVHGLNMVNSALSIILTIDIGAILLLGLAEDSLERWRGEKFSQTVGKTERKAPVVKREPGSDLPIPAGELLPSLYNLLLPLPELPRRGTMVKPRPALEEPSVAGGIATPSAPPRPVSTPAAASTATPTTPSTPSREFKPAPKPATTSAPAASVEPGEFIEHALDPDAAARAQMDPRVPRTSGESPFKRAGVPEAEKPATPTPPAGRTMPPTEPPRRSAFAAEHPEHKPQEVSPEPPRVSTGTASPFGKRDETASTSEAEGTRRPTFASGRTPTESIPSEEKPAEPASRFGRTPTPSPLGKPDESASTPESEGTRRPAFGRTPVEEEKTAEPASRFGRTPAPSPFGKPDESTPESEGTRRPAFGRTPVEEEKPVEPASRFGRTPAPSPLGKPDESTTESEGTRRPAFGRTPVEEEKPTEPASRFGRSPSTPPPAQPGGRFGRPTEPTPTPQDTRASSPTGRFNPDETQSMSSTQEFKPARPSGQFTPPGKGDTGPLARREPRPFQPAKPRVEKPVDEDAEDDVKYEDFDDA